MADDKIDKGILQPPVFIPPTTPPKPPDITEPIAALPSDPEPQPPIFSGKNEDFPKWVRDDIAWKLSYQEWLTRQRRK